VLAAVCRACVVSGGSAAMQWTVGECMQCVSWIVQCIAEQPVVRLIQQLLKVRQIRRAVAATFVTSQERVDSFKVRRRCEASPRERGVHQPRHHYSSEDRAGGFCSGTVSRANVRSPCLRRLRDNGLFVCSCNVDWVTPCYFTELTCAVIWRMYMKWTLSLSYLWLWNSFR